MYEHTLKPQPELFLFCVSTGELGVAPGPAALGHLSTFTSQNDSPSTRALDLSGLPPGDLGQVQDVSLSTLPGLPAVPQKFIKKILSGEYVDMAELRPDAWRMEELLYNADQPAACPGTVKNLAKKRPVTDILQWVECYSVMSAVITTKFPERASHLFAYQRTIVKASQLFEAPAWINYDTQFRRKACLLKSWEWGVSDTALYNECFTGRARNKIYCRFCFSDAHTEKACPLAVQSGQCTHTAPVTYAAHDSPVSYSQCFTPAGNRWMPRSGSEVGPGAGEGLRKAVELCGKFNKFTGNECTYVDCRFAHICSRCFRGPHPASQCPGPRPLGPQARQRRPPAPPLPAPPH